MNCVPFDFLANASIFHHYFRDWNVDLSYLVKPMIIIKKFYYFQMKNQQNMIIESQFDWIHVIIWFLQGLIFGPQLFLSIHDFIGVVSQRAQYSFFLPILRLSLPTFQTGTTHCQWIKQMNSKPSINIEDHKIRLLIL